MPSIIRATTTSGLQVAPDNSGSLQLQTNGTTTALTIDTSQNATFAGTVAMGSSFLRNRIINGDIRIDQRNAGASVTLNGSANTYPADRFASFASIGTVTGQQSSEVPTGFNNSLLYTITSSATVGASDRVTVSQFIEGLNTADLGWGTANAKTVTLSFWVRSSLTGTFGGALKNSAVDRAYPFNYTISAANTWEYKTITIAGDTTGTWLTTNGIGIRVAFGLGVGSTLSGTAGAWVGANYWSATGAVSVVGTGSATWYITGVQLEVGSTATPFERRMYGQELALCQRYYYKWTNDNAGVVDFCIFQAYASGSAFGKLFDFPVTMRTTPTGTASGTFNPYNTTGSVQAAFTSTNIDSLTKQSAGAGGWTGSSGMAAGNATGIRASANAFIALSAEL
jgi:hypothetical protein